MLTFIPPGTMICQYAPDKTVLLDIYNDVCTRCTDIPWQSQRVDLPIVASALIVLYCVCVLISALGYRNNLMLLSHCGEYTNWLTNAFRHEFVMIANDRQTFVSVRKHSRSFLWCFECYAGLTSGECMENGLTNAIRHQFAMIAQ